MLILAYANSTTGFLRRLRSNDAMAPLRGTTYCSSRNRSFSTTRRSASKMTPKSPYPPNASEKSSLFSERLQRTTDPSDFISRKDSTVDAIGGRPYCQPWQFTLSDPPTVKELSDCI